MRSIALGSFLLLALAACAGSDTDTILDVCNERLDLDEQLCRCVADRAGTELSADGRQLLVAMLEGDSRRAEQIRQGGIGLDEVTRVATFVTSAPASCARDAAGARP